MKETRDILVILVFLVLWFFVCMCVQRQKFSQSFSLANNSTNKNSNNDGLHTHIVLSYKKRMFHLSKIGALSGCWQDARIREIDGVWVNGGFWRNNRIGWGCSQHDIRAV
jgi:hypothetical protein